MKQRGFRHCGVCQNRLQKRGKTDAGTQRWYCPFCAKSGIKPRPDLSRAIKFESFLSWLLGKDAQTELNLPARTFRYQTTWCWDIPIPSVLTGEVHHAVIVDGIVVGGQVCLIARTVSYVIAWIWVDREKSETWSQLLRLLPPPKYIVCDGQKGLLKAISETWPDTTVQRCRFHLLLNIGKKLTKHPRTQAGRDLRDLAVKLQYVRTKRQARLWERSLKCWYRKYKTYIDERTIKTDPKPRERKWRYTHEKLRSAYNQMYKQQDNVLRYAYRPHSCLPATTNHLEGGVNSQIRSKLSYHRGLSSEHQKVLVDWYLYSRTETKKPPRFCL